MVDNEPMEFFDFAQAFSDLNSKIESMASSMTALTEELKKKKEEYPYPYPKEKKKKMSEDGDEEDEEKKEMAAKIKEYEEKEKNSLLNNLAELQGNEAVKSEFSEFSIEQIKKLIDMSKTKTVNFGKTLKGKEEPSDNSKKIAELEQKKADLELANLNTEEVQKELDSLKSL